MSAMPENYSTPTSPEPDVPPAWIKGDLPDEHETGPQPAPSLETDKPTSARSLDQRAEDFASKAAAAAPAGAESDPTALRAAADARAVLETAALSKLYAAVVDELIAVGVAPVAGGAEMTEAASTVAEVRDVSPAAIELPVIDPLGMEALIESLLFVADGAVPVARLAEALEASTRDVEAALSTLGDSYHQRGLNLQRFRDKVQLTTSPAAAGRVERFLGLAALTPLSRAALEALAIVAYQQPVTRPQIEAIRGVNSDSVIKNLLTKGLIEESGRAEGPGRPVLYSTTAEFMQHFGLSALSELPPLSLAQAPANPAPETILKS